MHLGLTALARFFAAHRQADALVLATVTAIEGSSYRKPGAMMLIGPGGEYAGMISGGCLEDDLLLHAAEVLTGGEPRSVTYDTQADEQTALGLGLGCEGVVHLLLQRLERDDEFGFFGLLFDSLARRRGCVLALASRSDCETLPPGSFALMNRDRESRGDPRLLECLREHAPPWPARRRHRRHAMTVNGQPLSVLLIDLPPVPRVLVCGAGPDALPLSRLIAELGWEGVIVDHRPAYAQAEKFPAASAVLKLRPRLLSERVDLDEIAAAVVMTHNLEHDAAYLEQLLAAGVPYLGLLGPSARRARLERRLGCAAGRIHGPVGLDIGAELPESIALATVAEIHAALNGRDGGMLAAAVTGTERGVAAPCRDEAS